MVASFKVLNTGHGIIVNGKWIAVRKYRYRNYPISGKYPNIKYTKAKCPALVVAQCPFASSRLDLGKARLLRKQVYTAGDSIGKAQSPSLLGAKYFWEVANSSEDVAKVA